MYVTVHPLFFMKYKIKINDIGMCMSVRCDFYQTCTNNSVNMFYKTKRKFEPILDGDQCLSFGSGKNTEVYQDNCYPKVLKKIYNYS
jgi:hypothetical protein